MIRAAVMRLEHHELDRLIAKFLRHLAHGEKNCRAICSFCVIHVDVTVMHPIMHILGASLRHSLCAISFSWCQENQVVAAAVDIDCIAKVTADPSRCIQHASPAGPPPRAGPARLARLLRLSEGDEKRSQVLLFLSLTSMRAPASKLLKRLMRSFPYSSKQRERNKRCRRAHMQSPSPQAF